MRGDIAGRRETVKMSEQALFDVREILIVERRHYDPSYGERAAVDKPIIEKLHSAVANIDRARRALDEVLFMLRHVPG